MKSLADALPNESGIRRIQLVSAPVAAAHCT
jgi:hypothetical protein